MKNMRQLTSWWQAKNHPYTMKKMKAIYFILFFTLTSTLTFAQDSTLSKRELYSLKDTSKIWIESGLYIIIQDSTHRNGFHFLNSKKKYYLVSDYIVTLRYLDNVKTIYDKLTKQLKLRLSFDLNGASEISESVSKNHNEYFGLLLNNKLVSIGSINSFINNNQIELVLNCTLSQLEIIKQEIKEEANYLRHKRRATKRGKPKN